ncbi:MAG: hypothetical protein A2418_00725 [Candidatus Brennerbacteria bacterium RIFOXYC1_FULL_41_11]|uniref:Uncharacterized protein n=1 Tax=Candidatus Brennerbacteria bacterium RIFOXYD1_FULL_41_16 TaxID=1797529 RepID=A0A1G1XL10_9BACT|nr:MAG: hypothetical protein A2418_00725 [Candidatus Brennerbacteria bacterium RIFOXYC1_FULL_41_11]OGY40835.1 MAG: hypothetical protein A2570_00260 [Candidatus Brennerbacteria bacterium RIFOXYD1_FULL_41_16]
MSRFFKWLKPTPVDVFVGVLIAAIFYMVAFPKSEYAFWAEITLFFLLSIASFLATCLSIVCFFGSRKIFGLSWVKWWLIGATISAVLWLSNLVGYGVDSVSRFFVLFQ